jgi:hypothetical protein
VSGFRAASGEGNAITNRLFGERGDKNREVAPFVGP